MLLLIRSRPLCGRRRVQMRLDFRIDSDGSIRPVPTAGAVEIFENVCAVQVTSAEKLPLGYRQQSGERERSTPPVKR